MKKPCEHCPYRNDVRPFLHPSIVDNLMCYELTREEERDFIGKLGDFFNCEPWHFIETKPSDEYLFLYELHNKIKKVA